MININECFLPSVPNGIPRKEKIKSQFYATIRDIDGSDDFDDIIRRLSPETTFTTLDSDSCFLNVLVTIYTNGTTTYTKYAGVAPGYITLISEGV